MRSKKLSTAFFILLLAGFTAGLIYSILSVIIPSHYCQYKMYRLLAYTLQESLNKSVLISFLAFLSLWVVSLTVGAVWKLYFIDVLEINVKEKRQPGYILSGSLLIFLFVSGGLWGISHYSSLLDQLLPRKVLGLIDTFLGILTIISFSIFLGWLLSYTSHLKKIAMGLLALLFLLNISLGVDRLVNPPTGPNVILISIDTLRADHLGAYGYTRNTSPHIDAFARENILFKNSFSQDDWTLPSHMSIVTSLYPPAHGVTRKTRLDPSKNTLAEVLKNAGYNTLGFAQDCIWMYAKYGFNQGFDSYIVKNYNPENPKLNGEFQNAFLSSYLEKYRKKKIFLFMHYYDVHSDTDKLPYDSPAPYMGMFSKNYQGTFQGGLTNRFATKYLMYVNHNCLKIDPEDLEYITSLYDNGIAYMDKCIGDLFKMLKHLGLYDNSLIILTSDHGEEFREHGRMLHNFNQFYDETIHTPLIVKLPENKKKHREITALVENLDIMPSILDHLGIKYKEEMQGSSFIGLINNTHPPEEKAHVFAFGDDGNIAIRTHRWKLISDDLYAKVRYKLFDLREDPSEHHDVKDMHPEITERLRNEVLAKYNELQNGSATEKIGLTEEQKEKLEALGYLH